MIYAWSLVIGFTIFRLFYSSLFLLIPDETNYWQWSRHLAFGYHDNAPLVAWIIRLFTTLFGQSEVSVRMHSVLSMSVVSIYLIAMAKRWFNSRTAFHTALLSQGMLSLNVCGLLATYDSLQALAWAGGCYHAARAFEEDTWSQWLIAGFWFGIGMLSKYSMVFFLPGILIFGLVSKDHRKRLATPRPYIATLLGSLMFFPPVIYWNMTNNWNSFRHVGHLAGADEGFTIQFRYLGEYLAGQAGLVTPFVFILVIVAWYYVLFKNRHNWIMTFLFWMSFSMFACFAFLSFHSRVYVNWPGPTYLTAIVLTAALFTGSDAEAGTLVMKTAKLWPVAVVTSYLLTAVLLLHVVSMVLPIPAGLDRMAKETTGWDTLGQKTEEIYNTMPDKKNTFIFGLQYQIASELAFYVPGQPQTVSINKWKRPNVYDYWWKDEDLLGKDAVGVTKNPEDHLTRLRQVFEHVDPPVRLTIFHESPPFDRSPLQPLRTYYIYRAYGFKGGLKWVPGDQSDIRADIRAN